MAAVDFLLKIEGVDGESKQDGHDKWIDVLSWSWGEHNASAFSTGGGGGAGKVTMQEFSFTQKMHNGSPKLMKQCADGTHFNKAEFRARKTGGGAKCFLTLKFEKVMISSYQTGGQGDDPLPLESISFGFSKIEMEYKEQLDTGELGGPMQGGFDLKKGVAI
jgi:type VI secretion system secreted protein Hcp